jgi:hypothetical protein
MRAIHLLRKPLDKPTVAANTLEYGAGGLNVDATRIGFASEEDRERAFVKQLPDANDSIGTFKTRDRRNEPPVQPHANGRWPSNLVLEHAPDCTCHGTKVVFTRPYTLRDNRGTGHSKYRFQGEGTSRGDLQPGYTDLEGNEVLADWRCSPDCPVHNLDLEVGVRTSGKPGIRRQNHTTGSMNSPLGTREHETGFGDTGFVSRFYKQVGRKCE